MDIKSLVLKELNKKGRVRVADIIRATGFSRAYINRFFQELRKEGKIALIGKANQAYYVKAGSAERAKKKILNIRRILENTNVSEDEVLDEIKRNSGVFDGIPENIAGIVGYAFTEMLNNAVEHSRSKKILVNIKRDNIIFFEVIDFGVGIFKNIKRKKRLNNEMEAIQDLLKGKQTTVPKEHTGEGIFFTSKVADKLIIRGSAKKLIFDNNLNDVFIRDSKSIRGTKVVFEINIDSKKNLLKIFKDYSGKTFSFEKTKIKVSLYAMDSVFISRSQARRILSGLDNFKEIVLDFKGVETIGQAFVDEVFRVWQLRHPQIKIIFRNANENVLFMIKRALG